MKKIEQLAVLLKIAILTCYPLFRNLTCSAPNLLTVKTDRISVALNYWDYGS